jgi:hypothetical protein
MRHRLATRYVVITTVVLLLAAVGFAVFAGLVDAAST